MIQTVTFYTFQCDWPGCETTAQENGEFAAWDEPSSCVDDAVNADWNMSPDQDRGYCPDHLTVWTSDLEGGEEGGTWDLGAITSWPVVVLDDLLEDEGHAYLATDPEDLTTHLDNLAKEPTR